MEQGYDPYEIDGINYAIATGDEDYAAFRSARISLADNFGETDENKEERHIEDVLEANINPSPTSSILGWEDSPAIPEFVDYGADKFPGLDEVWRELGVEGVITWFPWHFVDAQYTFLDWVAIRQSLIELEIRPIPGKQQIMDACGASKLDFPEVVYKGRRFFDFSYIEKTLAQKRERTRDYAQMREVVRRFLISPSPLPEEPNL